MDLPLVSPQANLRDCLMTIEGGARGIALVVDAQGRLQATLTDGDLRRAILAQVDLDATSVGELLETSPHPSPVTASVDATPEELLALMNTHFVRQIPLLDSGLRVRGLVTIDELLAQSETSMRAVVMAGGLGVRLRPLTEHLPKPMLPVGDRPLLEHILAQLKQGGVNHVYVTTHYKADLISDYFGDGSQVGLELEFVREDRPLGTAGALRLLPEQDKPLLVINGDILTQVDFRAMLTFHEQHGSDLTVAVRAYKMDVPYGVVECDGLRVIRVEEKPSYTVFINAGIYLLQPDVYNYIPSPGEPFHMTELIDWLVAAGRKVVSFPVWEYWIDIGRPDQYAQANSDIAQIR